MATSLLPSDFFSFVVVVANKAMITSLLLLPFFFCLVEAKMGDGSKLDAVAFFFLLLLLNKVTVCYCHLL